MTKSKGIRKPSVVSREDQLANAAQARAQVLSFFHNNDKSYTGKELWELLGGAVQKFGYTKAQLQTQLDVLVKSEELVSFTRDGKVQKHYAPRGYVDEQVLPEEPALPHTKPKVKVKASAQQANLVKINVVKATGAVQIVTQGLTIEINVV